MDISLVAETVSVATIQSIGFAKFLFRRHVSLSDSASDQSSSSYSSGGLQISAVIFPLDALAPPPVKSNIFRSARRTLLRRKRLTRRRLYDGDSEDEEFDGFPGDGFDGPVDGGSGRGGRGWNFDRFGEHNWDESWSSSPSDHAFDFVYEVLSWIALSNCVHFAFKKLVRIVADGIGEAEREKIPLTLTVC